VLGALLLGASLGAGYLAKPIMFPMSLVFLGVLYGILRKAKPSRVTMAFMAFCAVAGPFVTTLSLAKGRFTFSDQGLFNYTWYVVDAPHYTVHWQGEDPAQGHPKHPTRMLSKKPAAYEFATPIKGTYPVWYDPTYWCDGTKYHFILKQQFRAIHRNCAKIASVFLGGLNGAIISSAFLLFWTCARKFIAACDIWKHWFLLVPSILAIAVYALIAVEPRYLGMFTALIGIVLLTGTDNYNRTLTSGVAILLSVSCLIATYEESSKVFFDALRGKWHRSNVSWDIADRLRELGLREGDNIASVNYSAADIARWARLAKVRIIAEVPHLRGEVGDGFWDAAPEKRTEIIHLFAKTGAVLVVSNEKPNGPDGSGWIQVGGFDSAEGESQDRATYALPLLNLLDRTAQGSPR
jgi:hypothetical protein